MAVTRLSAATLTVDLNGGADYTDIQSAMIATKDGDQGWTNTDPRSWASDTNLSIGDIE